MDLVVIGGLRTRRVVGVARAAIGVANSTAIGTTGSTAVKIDIIGS